MAKAKTRAPGSNRLEDPDLINPQPNSAIIALSKKLWAEKLCLCKICETILIRAPIWIHFKCGNICSVCCLTYYANQKEMIRNTTLEVVLNEIFWPCKYYNVSQGCKEFVAPSELEKHERTCKHLNISCMGKCSWKCQSPSQFLNHFKKKHADDIVNFEKNCVFNIPIRNDGEVLKLLSNKESPYFLSITIKNNPNDKIYFNKIQIKMFHAKHDNLKMDTAIVKLVGLNSKDVEMMVEIHPLRAFNDKTLGFLFNLSTVRKITGANDFISVLVEMSEAPKKPNNKTQIQKQMEAHFECPVCTELMRPPIYQCDTGHSICNGCKDKVVACPSCSKSFSDRATRNFAMEALTEALVYDCKYQEKGCSSKDLGGKIVQHESSCRFNCL